MTILPPDPAAMFRRLAIEAAADRLGLERPVTGCRRCGVALYTSDQGRPVDCDEPGCPAAAQLEELER